MSIAVAIDGPAGAGKSTIARAAAKALGFIYVDTGALYRSIGLNAIRTGVDITDSNAVENNLTGMKVELAFDAQGAQIVLLNGEDVSSLIRTPEVSMAASKVSAVPKVRAFLLDLQRNMAKTQSVIMDGRDIGTVVLPDAEVKIFLTASPEIRAKRRFDELIEKGQEVKYEDVLADVIERDYNDSHREIAPLKPAEDSKIADTSGLTLEESIDLIINIIKENT
ncbi:MAG: (d)CMP kinase [Clostridia bacterium]|nr:(d)CMP kinase [Clostridia bacterium]